MADSADASELEQSDLQNQDAWRSEIVQSWIKDAEGGSVQHQVKLGCHYLKLAELGVDKEDNALSAVKWLVAASKQGNEEATVKLRHCAQTNLGINATNKGDVTWCLNTSASEKKIRQAARSLFNKINVAQDGVLSTEEYTDAINKLTEGHEKERKLLLAAGKKIGSTITENDFVKTMSKKISGTLTLTASEMDDHSADYNSAPLYRKIVVYPKETAMLVFDQGLEFASKEGMDIVLSLIPTNQLYVLAMVFAYSYLTPKLFLLVVPLIVFYISILALIICTLQMFYKRRKQKDASTLVNLLQDKFDVDIDSNSTESQYTWNSLTPYLVFFGILPVVIISFSLANKGYVPCAELFVIGQIMTGLCFMGLNDSHDGLTLAALGSHAFASLPIFLAMAPRIPVLTYLLEFFIQPFFSFDLGAGVSFNLGLPAVIHLAIPVLLIRMAMRDSWRGSYRIVIPHLICYFWFSLSVVVFPFTTWKGLVRATLGYMLFPLLVPLSLLFAVLGVGYLFYKLLMTQMAGKLIVTLMLLSVPIIMSQTKAFTGKKKKGEKESANMEKMRKGIMIGFAVLAIIPLLFIHVPAFTETKEISLSWEEYKYLCLPAADETSASYQLRCRDFVGTKVNWTGTAVEVKVTKVENTAESVINSFPSVFADPLYCIYGEAVPECDPETMPEKALKHCELMAGTGRSCHLRNQDQISLALSVAIDGTTVTLDAGTGFHGHLMALAPGDVLQFTGSLADVGTSAPGLKLRSMNVISRDLMVMEEQDDGFDEDHIYKMANEAFALTFNFGFFPILKYSPF